MQLHATTAIEQQADYAACLARRQAIAMRRRTRIATVPAYRCKGNPPCVDKWASALARLKATLATQAIDRIEGGL